jgi:hypothetical protein
MHTASPQAAEDDSSHFFRDRAQLEQQIARFLGEFSRNHPDIGGLNLSLYRRIGNRTAAEEFSVLVHPCR